MRDVTGAQVLMDALSRPHPLSGYVEILAEAVARFPQDGALRLGLAGERIRQGALSYAQKADRFRRGLKKIG